MFEVFERHARMELDNDAVDEFQPLEVSPKQQTLGAFNVDLEKADSLLQ